MAAAAVDDMGDSMQCSNHPYRNNPGGICAFCLQEKLGKLVSSSFPLPIHGSSASSPSSSPPSFRSDATAAGFGFGFGFGTINGGGIVTSSSASSLSLRPTSISTQRNDQYYYTTRRARVPFLLAKKKKNIMVASSTSSDRVADIVLKRSKSTATPRRGHGHFLEADNEDFSPRKKGFWSFLYHTSLSRSSSRNKVDKITAFAASNGVSSHIVTEKDDDGEDDSPNRASQATASSCDRKVSRSRSVGCGSRSFSGDLFERISTGFGDCSLRRVESQREGKPKLPNNNHMKERVKCGGIFGGFIIMSSSNSSSSSSSSSSYWVSSSSADHQIQDHVNGKSLAHGRSKSWGWAFASPMRAFGSKPSSKDGSKRSNLAASPSLLAVRG